MNDKDFKCGARYVGVVRTDSVPLRDGAEFEITKLLVKAGLIVFPEPCVIECHDGPSACEACMKSTKKSEMGTSDGSVAHGEGGKLAPLDLTKFQASGVRFHKGQLERPLTKQTYEERAKSCPPCSKTDFGCAPPPHWAFARNPKDRHP